jgi:hypothetical protein
MNYFSVQKMKQATQSKYFVIGNRPLATWQEILYKQWPEQTVYEWYISLPPWFKLHKGQKIIKFFGSNIELQKQSITLINGEHTQVFELPQHVTIHSNLVGFSNSGETSFDFDEGHTPIPGELPNTEVKGVVGPFVKPFSSEKLYIIPDKSMDNKPIESEFSGGFIYLPDSAEGDAYNVIYNNIDIHNYLNFLNMLPFILIW